jgi:hypothetical protein
MKHVAGQEKRLFRQIRPVKEPILVDQFDQGCLEAHHDTLGISGSSRGPDEDLLHYINWK